MIELSMVRLINWYAFNNITAPLANLRLLPAGTEMENLSCWMRSSMRFMEIRFSINPQRIKEAVPLHHIPEDC